MIRLLLYAAFFHTSTIIAQDNNVVSHFLKPKPIELEGQLGLKMGTVLTVQGIVIEGDQKGYTDGPNLLVQTINDSFIQDLVQIPMSPYFGDFGEKKLPKLAVGSTYSLRVYETGEFNGAPPDAFKESGVIVQTAEFYFQNRLMVLSGEKINPIDWSPDKFLGRSALLSGATTNDHDTAMIETAKWKLKLIGSPKWKPSDIGKLAEVNGLIQATQINNVYKVVNGEKRLVKLEDQLGRSVKLKGLAMSLNGHWWFHYRGIDLYVEKMQELPGWKEENHFLAMEITGLLEQAELPNIQEISIKAKPGLKTYYIVRNAGWSPTTELLAPEVY